MHRVFFDTNTAGTDALGRFVYWLTLASSERDLTEVPDKRDGMRVLLHMPNELEVEAILFYDPREFWVGLPINDTVRMLGES